MSKASEQKYGTIIINASKESVTYNADIIGPYNLIIKGPVTVEGHVDITGYCEISKALCPPNWDFSHNSYHIDKAFDLVGQVAFKNGFHCNDVSVVEYTE